MAEFLLHIPAEVCGWVCHHVVHISVRNLHVTKQTQAPFVVRGEPVSSVGV